jgi:type VI secretion system protein ImpF
MAHLDLPPALMPSLLDRLLDPDSMGTSGRPGYSLQQIIDAVRADLEDLLNTRQPHKILDTEYSELSRSIAAYGLPDLASLDTSTPAAQEAIGHIIEQLISLYEPRLRNVRATMLQAGDGELRVKFHIDAELCVDPAPEVAFETVVELTTGQAKIQDRAS